MGRHSDSKIFQDIPRYLQRNEVWIGLNWLVDTGLDISNKFCNARPLSLWGSFDQSPPEHPKPRGKSQLCIVPTFFSSTSYQGGTRIYKAYHTTPQNPFSFTSFEQAVWTSAATKVFFWHFGSPPKKKGHVVKIWTLLAILNFNICQTGTHIYDTNHEWTTDNNPIYPFFACCLPTT